MCEGTFNDTGDNGEGVPPVLIPNTEVKPFSAESTWLDTAREDMTLPVTKKEESRKWFFFLSDNYIDYTERRRERCRFSSCKSVQALQFTNVNEREERLADRAEDVPLYTSLTGRICR